MGTSPVISALERKYAYLLGEFETVERLVEGAEGVEAVREATARCDARKEEINELLGSLETVIWLFEPNWDPASVKPVRQKQKFGEHGEIIQAAVRVLRDAAQPLTTVEIAKRVVVSLRLEPSGVEIERLDHAISSALVARSDRMFQIASENPNRWILMPRDEVKNGTHKRKRRAATIPVALPNLEAVRPTRSA
jgi:hypothetical protein